MKLNWGSGIAIFYTCFVLAFVFLVFKSTQYDNSLVSNDYYADDLKYQEHFDKLLNSSLLVQDLKIWNKTQKQEVELLFPAIGGEVKGEIHFFRPSDSKLDFKIAIKTDAENVQSIPTNGLKQGLWKVKVDWQAAGKAFYTEEAIRI